jgi:hypothetical protein
MQQTTEEKEKKLGHKNHVRKSDWHDFQNNLKLNFKI